MVEPYFKMLWNEEVLVCKYVNEAGKKTTIDIIVGEILGKNMVDPTPNAWAANEAKEVGIFIFLRWKLELLSLEPSNC